MDLAQTATQQPFVFSPATAASTAAAATGGGDPLVNQTRREIAEIVREIARAVASDRTRDEFLQLLVDRMLRAMAAEGVMVWQRQDPEALKATEDVEDGCDRVGCDRVGHNPEEHVEAERTPRFVCLHRLGRITDRSIPTESQATHDRLLREVAETGTPVVVPATPGAIDPNVPANPTEVPVAIVSIDCLHEGDTADYLLQVFLEPGCGVATQRGYLRFVAQMGDLAGEFLRADRLRQFQRRQQLSERLEAVIGNLHQATRSSELASMMVDQAAAFFGFDRVGLCLKATHVRLIAVSHVDTIDQHSPAAKRIRDAAENAPIDARLRMTHDPEHRENRPQTAPFEQEVDTRAISDDDSANQFGQSDHSMDAVDDEGLSIAAVVAAESNRALRLVCLQKTDASRLDQDKQVLLARFMKHAGLAWNRLSQLEAVPGARWFAALGTSTSGHSIANKYRWILASVSIVTLILIGMFPIPLVVRGQATLRPVKVESFCAPRDCLVDQIHVDHGQHVNAGQRLITLTDPDLENQIAQLVGDRSVLEQSKSHWTTALIDTASSHRDHWEKAQAEQLVLEQRIEAIDQQLALLNQARESLTFYADVDGVVDAWQINERLKSRPLQRGDLLMRVVAHETSWAVDARVPQKQTAEIQDADRDSTLSISVVLDVRPDQPLPARLTKVGPAIRIDGDSETYCGMTLDLSEAEVAAIARGDDAIVRFGAPATASFRCGRAPLVFVLFRDLIDSVQGTWAVYVAPPSSNPLRIEPLDGGSS